SKRSPRSAASQDMNAVRLASATRAALGVQSRSPSRTGVAIGRSSTIAPVQGNKQLLGFHQMKSPRRGGPDDAGLQGQDDRRAAPGAAGPRGAAGHARGEPA